jgi:hypothetical protein
MMPSLLSQLLVGDCCPKELRTEHWNKVIQQARASQTLAMLYHRLKYRGQWEAVPEKVRWHLESAAKLADKYRRDLELELEHIAPAIQAQGDAVVLLKGGAYVLEDLECFKGRIFSDIDLLIPRSSLSYVESALKWLGWGGGHHSDYDQRYYREWMHELPPLIHAKRFTVLDLHHTILPLTARYKPSGALLLNEAELIKGRYYRLSRIDQLLHSATHLFTDSEWDHAYRDLVDCDALVRLLIADHVSMDELINRARQLDLLMPLALVLRYAKRVLNTPVPLEWLECIKAAYSPWLPWSWMDKVYTSVLCPPHPECYGRLSHASLRLLFLRGHSLRMPFAMLLRHLSYKAFIAPFKESKESEH